ncbi:MAG: PilZ domain-containing protein [Candidatus Eremiobacterota bacterium]
MAEQSEPILVRYLNEILNSAPDACLILSLDAQVEAANEAAQLMLGCDDLPGRKLADLLVDKPLGALITQQLLKEGTFRDFHLNLQVRSGEVVPVSLTSSLLYTLDQRPAGVLMFARDLRESQHLQDQLLQSAKMNAMGQMAAGIAHELNNPLQGILGLTELLLKGREPSDALTHDLEQIRSLAVRCRDVIGSLMRFSRSGHVFKWEELNPNEILMEVIHLTQNERKLNLIELATDLDPHLPRIWAEPNHLSHVFVNLVLNACQAMPGGGTLTVRSRSQRDRIQIQVEDTGIGIAEGDLERIFEPFHTTRPPGMGVGLGLSLSQSMIRALGGTLQVRSVLGEGSCFTVELARAIPELVEDVAWQSLRGAADRRRHPRIPLALPVDLQDESQEVRILSEDIGVGGLRLCLDQPLEASREYRLRLPLQDFEVLAYGQVAWQRPLPDKENRYEVGILFTQLDPHAQNQLRGYLESQPETGQELRRRALRIPRLRFFSLDLPEGTRQLCSGLILDIGQDGARLLSSLRLTPGQVVTMHVELEGELSEEVTAEVCWSEVVRMQGPGKASQYLHGINFQKTSQTIEDWLARYLAERAASRQVDFREILERLLARSAV